MPAASWELFLATYRKQHPEGGREPALSFWKIVATVISASVRVERNLAHSDVPLTALDRLAEGFEQHGSA